MGRCSALSCVSQSRYCKQFRFPRDPERRRKWVEACRRDFTPTNSSFLCDKHFAFESFENRRADGLRKLKPNAIPTIFDFPEPVSQIKNNRLRNFDRILQQLDDVNSRENQIKMMIEERCKNTKKFENANSVRCSSLHSLSLIGENEHEKDIAFDDDEGIKNEKSENMVCRVCGGQQSELIPVFEDDGLEFDLPTKIRKHFYTIDITNWEKSAKICYQCISVLNSWHELFIQCETVNLESGLLLPVIDSRESQDVATQESNYHPDADSTVEPENESKNRSLLDFIRIVPTNENDSVAETSDDDSSLCGNAPSITSDNPADLKYNWSPPGSTTKSVKTAETQSTTTKDKKHRSNPNMLPPLCHICHKTFSCTLAKRMHLRSVHTDDRPYLCHLCELTFKRRDHLNGHIRRVHEKSVKKIKYEKPILCPDCGKILSNRKTYEAHADNIHDKRIREYECNLCDRKFGSYVSCYNHRVKHRKGIVQQKRKNFSKSCPYCCLNFENEYYYVKHMCQHEEIVDCEMCQTKFDTHEDYNKHVEEVHIGQKTLECATCGKKFSAKMNLKNHIKTHMNEKRYECSYCNWKFLKRAQLRIHEYRHTGEHPYTCDFCSRGFRQKSDFKRHVAAHLQKVKKAAEVPSTHIIEECIEVPSAHIVEECAEVIAE